MLLQIVQACHFTIRFTVCYKLNQVNKTPSKLGIYWSFLWGIHWWLVDSLHKWPVMRKAFPYHDVFIWPHLLLQYMMVMLTNISNDWLLYILVIIIGDNKIWAADCVIFYPHKSPQWLSGYTESLVNFDDKNIKQTFKWNEPFCCMVSHKRGCQIVPG